MFARPEYRWVEGRHPLEWLAQLWRRLGEWLDTLQATHPAWHWTLIVVLTVVLVGLLVHIAWIVWRVTRPTLRAAAGPVAPGAPVLGASAHLERAEALAREGRFVEALAHRFLAVVLQLEEARAVAYHPAKTPAEYVAEARLDAGGRASLAALVARLYRHVFGAAPCDAVAYGDFGHAAGEVVRHVVPG
ncbi:MAG: DUF4129 domain-containing protein [Gemmatimonadales bacterium]